MQERKGKKVVDTRKQKTGATREYTLRNTNSSMYLYDKKTSEIGDGAPENWTETPQAKYTGAEYVTMAIKHWNKSGHKNSPNLGF